MYILPFKSAFECFKVSLCINLVFAFFGAIWLFWRVDLDFFACDYLATLFFRMFVSTRTGWRSQTRFWVGTSFDFKRATAFCFQHRLSKHKI